MCCEVQSKKERERERERERSKKELPMTEACDRGEAMEAGESWSPAGWEWWTG